MKYLHLLWSYGIQLIVERYDIISLGENRDIPLDFFTSTKDKTLPTDVHNWIRLVSILDTTNQSGIGNPKWETRDHTSICIRHSSYHDGSVTLHLNMVTGLVSHQFRIMFDDKLTTVPYISSDTIPPKWKDLLEQSSEKSLKNRRNYQIIGFIQGVWTT